MIRRFLAYWKSLHILESLVIQWLILAILAGLIFLGSYLLDLHNPILYRYFLGLFVVDSLFFFLVYKTSPTIGRTMLFFLIVLELSLVVYYLFSYLDLTA